MSSLVAESLSKLIIPEGYDLVIVLNCADQNAGCITIYLQSTLGYSGEKYSVHARIPFATMLTTQAPDILQNIVNGLHTEILKHKMFPLRDGHEA